MLDKSHLLKKAARGDVSEPEVARLHALHNKGAGGADFRSDIAAKAAQFGYFKWPGEIRAHIRGKRILDVGCGAGTDSIGFITLGARSYVGIDQGLKPDSDVVKNKNGARLKGGLVPKTAFGWTPNQISAAFPQIRFYRGTFEELQAERDFETFDVVVMHTVTEHLLQIEDVFAGCAALLRSGGKMIYLHHNFYCWNGHHMAPKRVADIDEKDAKQRNYVDWNHITFDPPEGHYFLRGLNKIRLDDLKTLTERHFRIEEWREDRNDFGRLTPAILERHSAYSERELTTSKVFCIASKRDD